MELWIVESGQYSGIAEANDQWEAYNALKDEPPESLGQIVIARRLHNPDDEFFPCRTSMLYGIRWNKPEIARRFITDGIKNGLPDTTSRDIAEPSA